MTEANRGEYFFNRAAGVKIQLRLYLSKSAGRDVTVSPREVALQSGEVIEVRLKIRNRAARRITGRESHLVEPNDLPDYLEFVECGFLLAVMIGVGKEQQYFGTCLSCGTMPEGVRQLNLTYDFRLLKSFGNDR